jgi:hypothetical protein
MNEKLVHRNILLTLIKIPMKYDYTHTGMTNIKD